MPKVSFTVEAETLDEVQHLLARMVGHPAVSVSAQELEAVRQQLVAAGWPEPETDTPITPPPPPAQRGPPVVDDADLREQQRQAAARAREVRKAARDAEKAKAAASGAKPAKPTKTQPAAPATTEDLSGDAEMDDAPAPSADTEPRDHHAGAGNGAVSGTDVSRVDWIIGALKPIAKIQDAGPSALRQLATDLGVRNFIAVPEDQMDQLEDGAAKVCGTFGVDYVPWPGPSKAATP